MTIYFCDGLKEVSVLNGVVRLEFHRLQGPTTRGAASELEPVTVLRIALPPHGLAQAFSLLGQAQERLIQDGILQQPTAGALHTANPPPPKSPNFS